MPFWRHDFDHVEKERRNVVDVLPGFDVKRGLVGGVSGKEGPRRVRVQLHLGKL